jgi:putative transposase
MGDHKDRPYKELRIKITMTYDPEKHHRRSIRLREYDYSQSGAYFITICTYNRECLFGEIADGEMRLNNTGQMVQKAWNELPQRYAGVDIDAFIVMPNHVHGVIIIDNWRGESCIRPENDAKPRPKGDHKDRPYGTAHNSIGRIIQAFKSIATHTYTIGVTQNGWPPFPGKLWQRNYYEHIIRNENELNEIREYIVGNPIKWAEDENNPINLAIGAGFKPAPTEL